MSRSRTADDTALADMTEFAQQRFGAAAEHLETFQSLEGWSPALDLRWVDLDVGSPARTIRVYHAVDSRNHTRYVSYWDRDHSRYHPWQPVR